MFPKKKIYLDYAASTPVDPAVLRAMKPYFSEKFGNPGSLHSFGQEAITAVDQSRETIARAIGADFREIIFTGSATEANNLALRGVVGRERRTENGERIKPRVIVSAIEHESVLETARALERDGVEVVYLPVNRQGIADLKKLKESLNDQTILVSIMYANNEIGTIQPIAEIAKIVREFKLSNQQPTANNQLPVLHTDAAQAFQFLDCSAKNPGVDLMTLSAHKIYGPKGAGALFSTFNFQPLLMGGGQEFGSRSGTENVPAIVGFAKAVELRNHLLIQTNEQMRKLRDRLWRGIKKVYPRAKLNGITEEAISSQPPRNFLAISQYLPNILNVYFPGHQAQDLLTKFDLNGLAVSSGSACRSRAMESSYVINALENREQRTENRAKSSIRFSLGRPTTKQEIDAAVEIMERIL